MSRPFEARYGGTCEACGERVRVGDIIRYEPDPLDPYGSGAAVHDDCSDAEPVERPVTICGVCFLAKPCGCEDF